MKYENLKKVASIMGHEWLSLEALTTIRDHRHLFSQEVREEFDQFMKDGRELFFGSDDPGHPDNSGFDGPTGAE